MIQDNGRPESVFCNGWRPKYDQLRHEVKLTDFLLLYTPDELVRGWYVDRTIRPDAQMLLEEQKYYVELDTGHMSMGQIKRRQVVYRDVTDHLVLYVTLGTQRRVKSLIQASQLIDKIGLFTTLDEAMADPSGAIWKTREGELFSIASAANGDPDDTS